MNVGESDYRSLDEEYFVQATRLIVQRLNEHGITVFQGCNLPETSVAEFNGPTVHLAKNVSAEVMLFTLLHIFGHVVDYSLDEGSELGEGASLEEHEASERTASQYGLALLHEIGITELDQWLSDVWHRDWEYLKGIYGYGEIPRPSFSLDHQTIRFGRPLLKPKPIPPFRLRQFKTKVVI